MHRFPGRLTSTPARRLATILVWLGLALAWPTVALAQDLVIRFLNVGQGDAALITSPDGKTALIDGGGDNGYASYDLDTLGVDTLDLVIASHGHADHIGGLADILRTTVVHAYMDNGMAAATQAYGSVSAVVDAHHMTYLQPTPRTISLGSVSLRILPRPARPDGQNNASVGVLLTYGGFSVLFTGDAETEERQYWRLNARLPRVTVLKVAHHGASNGTDRAWIGALRPKVAVISVGANNDYGHPSSRTLSILRGAGAAVFRTDQDGAVIVTVSPTGAVAVRTEWSDRTWHSPASAAARSSP